MLKKFINRPVLATVISMILVLLGIVGIVKLPITRFPQIAPPSVSVSASYSGADAGTVAQSVLLPLEERINGVQDMTYIKSRASTGSGTVNIFFKAGTDPNQAAVNVQTRVSKAQSRLPTSVIENGVTVTPRQKGVVMTLNIYSVAPALNETFLQAYTNREVIRALERINGVSEVNRVGSRNYAVRIWLNPDKMKAFHLDPDDVKEAINDQNLDVALGEFGQNSSQTFQTVIKYTGKFTTAKQFKNIILKTTNDGTVLRLKDVAMVKLGPTNTRNVNRVDGHPGLTMNVTQTHGSNARDIDIAVRHKMKQLSKKFPKGVKYNISYSIKSQVDASIDQVLHTLVEAFILVFIVILIFLQDFRATIIPAIAIPVSLVGTFFFIYLLGFSINVLTMFALVLAIGLVVDDAIIIVEAIHKKMDSTDLSPTKASEVTMHEISPAIVSITLVMAAVFLPIGFSGGPSGVFYRQFAYTLAIAILISAVNALTLSPALCALFLRRTKKVSKEAKDEELSQPENRALKGKIRSFTKRFILAFNAAFEAMTGRYIKSVKFLTKRKKWAIGGFVVIAVVGFLLMRYTPTAFIPTEDDGFITYSIKLSPGSSLARTTHVENKAIKILKKRKEIKSMSSSVGFNGIDNINSTSYAVGYINMYPQKKRKGIKNINQFMDTVRTDLSQIKNASVSVFTRPTVTGFGQHAGLHFVLEDRLGENYQTLGAVADTFLTALNKRPEILSASTTFQPDFPKYELSVNTEKAKLMGVNVKDMLDNIRPYYSRVHVSEFNLFNRINNVYVQALPKYAATPKTLKSIYVRNKDGDMVPVSTLVNLTKTFGPQIVTRYNLFNSVEVNATPAKGYSTGQAMNAVKQLAAKVLPRNYQYQWTGLSLQEKKSSGKTIFIILLSILFVYFLLAALFESYLVPLSILLSVLVGLVGIFAAINIVGLQNNIYVQVALIMLIGLLAKNAILIVQFGEDYRKSGHSIYESAIRGAKIRLRPILMTSIAFVIGITPLMWTGGPSAQGNHSISFAAAGGMISGIVFGIFIVPVLYMVFRTLDEKLRTWFNKGKEEYA
jgi:HAE1 family hydrophobic/amphiphilic exporter-1